MAAAAAAASRVPLARRGPPLGGAPVLRARPAAPRARVHRRAVSVAAKKARGGEGQDAYSYGDDAYVTTYEAGDDYADADEYDEYAEYEEEGAAVAEGHGEGAAALGAADEPPSVLSAADELAAMAGEYAIDGDAGGEGYEYEATAEAETPEEEGELSELAMQDELVRQASARAAAVASVLAEDEMDGEGEYDDEGEGDEVQAAPAVPAAPSAAQLKREAVLRGKARKKRSRDKKVWNAKRNRRLKQIEKERVKEREAERAPALAEMDDAAGKGAFADIAAVVTSAAQGVAQSVGSDAVEAFNANVNPVSAGKRARDAMAPLWKALTGTNRLAAELQYEREEWSRMPEATLDDFRAPQAAYTKVLVVGGTGRVGRVLVRKLLLRGYKVRCMVQELPKGTATLEGLPASIELVRGDLRDPVDVGRAVRGCNKIICCARAKTPVRATIDAVDAEGPRLLCSALLNEYVLESQRRRGRARRSKFTLYNFERAGRDDMGQWEVHTEATEVGGSYSALSKDFLAKYKSQLAGTSKAETGAMSEEYGGEHLLKFSGKIASGGGAAEMVAPVVGNAFNAEGGKSYKLGERLANMEGIQLRLSSDRAKPYSLILEDAAGERYSTRFYTRRGFCTVRIPMGAFRAASTDAPPLGERPVAKIALRYERAAQPLQRGGVDREEIVQEDDSLKFGLALHFIKAMPAVEEPDIVLVSCAGAGVDESVREAVVEAKQRGEAAVKASGLCYTVVRPGRLTEEAGSNRALIFDQGDRVDQPISCADVADVCLRAMHDPAAANKAFDVSYERDDTADEYELVAHVPSADASYLATALDGMQRNT